MSGRGVHVIKCDACGRELRTRYLPVLEGAWHISCSRCGVPPHAIATLVYGYAGEYVTVVTNDAITPQAGERILTDVALDQGFHAWTLEPPTRDQAASIARARERMGRAACPPPPQ